MIYGDSCLSLGCQQWYFFRTILNSLLCAANVDVVSFAFWFDLFRVASRVSIWDIIVPKAVAIPVTDAITSALV